MTLELNIHFPEAKNVVVSLSNRNITSGIQTFSPPLSDKDKEDLRWYLEVYASSYTTDIDDMRAKNIKKKLPEWGMSLYHSVFFKSQKSLAFFEDFIDSDAKDRLLTISTSYPAYLALPWEIIWHPRGTYIFREIPRISIRRCLRKVSNKEAFSTKAKNKLQLLFIVSRPTDAGFIDPRVEAKNILDALHQEAPNQIEIEFLRPATHNELRKRLRDQTLPKIDILHFDGHGVFEETESTGYLLFTDPHNGKSEKVSAKLLSETLNGSSISTVILSACQSATETEGEAIGGVASQLTDIGIPAVLAMSYSVLVTSAYFFYSNFYRSLAVGKGIRESVDNAREYLYQHQERGTKHRLEGKITLTVEDWFIPTLYQSEQDTPLLLKNNLSIQAPLDENYFKVPENLSNQFKSASFWGRSWELWCIEREFSRSCRRLTISGLSGQGKTHLAIEAGRWLSRTRMFEKVCFIDYSNFQGKNVVSWAIDNLSTVLGERIIANKEIHKFLSKKATLIILDGLEALSSEALHELLVAAKGWSEVKKCRVIAVTRLHSLDNSGFSDVNSSHYLLSLTGLSSQRALAYFQHLMQLLPSPTVKKIPSSEKLEKLFRKVGYHFSSIKLLGEYLKIKNISEVEDDLNNLLIKDKNNYLLPSLSRYLSNLDKEACDYMAYLGIFQGGCMEHILLSVTSIPQHKWQQIRKFLEQSGLIEVENLLPHLYSDNDNAEVEVEAILARLGLFSIQQDNIDLHIDTNISSTQWESLKEYLVRKKGLDTSNFSFTYLKFNPILSPFLKSFFADEKRFKISQKYIEKYRQFTRKLYLEDRKNGPAWVRKVIQRETQNMISVARKAIDSNSEWAFDYIDDINYFLILLNFAGEVKLLRKWLSEINEDSQSTVRVSQSWIYNQSDLGMDKIFSGEYLQADRIFMEVLQKISNQELSFERCAILEKVGKTKIYLGQYVEAVNYVQQGIEEVQELEQTNSVKSLIGSLYTVLGNALHYRGELERAHKAYSKSLEMKNEIGGDERGKAVVQGQLADLAFDQGKFLDAYNGHCASLEIFSRLNEPLMIAIAHFNIAKALTGLQYWQEAELEYRQSAEVYESIGNLTVVAQIWNNLGSICIRMNQPREAESWFLKAIDGGKKSGDLPAVARSLFNLSQIYYKLHKKLSDARNYAEEAFAIGRNLDPKSVELWDICETLYEIANEQGDLIKAQQYYNLYQELKENIPEAN